MSIPTSTALDAMVERIALYAENDMVEGRLRSDIYALRRLQHEASTQPVVFDLDRYRRIREEAGMACHDDDPEAA